MPESGLPATGSIIRCLDNITRHREISLLNASVMTSLTDLLGLEHISLYDIFERNAKLFVALSAWDENGEIRYFEDIPAEDQLEEIERYPPIALHFERGCSAVNVPQDGDNIYCLPVRKDSQGDIAVLLMQRGNPLSAGELNIANGIVAVYRNFLSLLKESQHDTLTGLLNRKTFDHGLADLLPAVVKQEVRTRFAEDARSAAHSASHWLAIIDIDHFKRINDKYGHIFGDEVLILLANLMRKTFRKRDRLYRFGGEEFVLLIRNVDFNNALQKLEAFRNAVANYQFPQVGHFTVTIGFVQVHTSDTPEMVVGNADEALYYGKAHGRNQVNCYGTLIEKSLLSLKKYHNEAEFFHGPFARPG